MATKFEFNITEEIAVISDKNGYTKELNMISYNGAPPKLDLRNWSVDEDGEYANLYYDSIEFSSSSVFTMVP